MLQIFSPTLWLIFSLSIWSFVEQKYLILMWLSLSFSFLFMCPSLSVVHVRNLWEMIYLVSQAQYKAMRLDDTLMQDHLLGPGQLMDVCFRITADLWPICCP